MKIIRILLSLIFFILYFFLFLRLLESFSFLGDKLTFLQIFPGILKFISSFSLSSIIVFSILAITAVFGRWYCSVLCPLGTLQDIFIFFRKKFFKKKAFKYHKSLSIYHYGIFLISIILFLSGIILPLVFFEPFSVFGRLTANLFRPFLNFINNNLSYLFYQAGIIFLRPMTDYEPGIPVIIYSIVFFALMGFLSFFRGRFYCNLLCPTGAVLSALSRIPVFRFKILSDKCIKCGLCSGVCRSECIDISNYSIDISSCISCMDCLDVCPAKAVNYAVVNYDIQAKIEDESKEKKVNDSRRQFIETALKTGALIFPFAILPGRVSATVFSKFLPFLKKEAVMPPGAQSRRLFNEHCTACNLCTAVCPNQIIRPSVLEYGLPYIFQPILDYDKDYCLFECTRCTEVCPAGALKRLTQTEKSFTQIGQVNLIKDNCIVYQKELPCIACSEHCPTKAVDAYPYKKKGLFAPEIDQAVCVGCGACESVCPARPKAIYVEGNIIHSTAKKKENKASQNKPENNLNKKENKGDFPF